MDSSRTKVASAVYLLGLAGPGVLTGLLSLVERAGFHLGVGGGLIAIVSLGACIAGASIRPTTVRKKLVLVLIALVIIPMEILVLGFIYLGIYGLDGTQ